jgi:hypothetical protein
VYRVFGILKEDSVFCARNFTDIDFRLFDVLINGCPEKDKNQTFAGEIAHFCGVSHTGMACLYALAIYNKSTLFRKII